MVTSSHSCVPLTCESIHAHVMASSQKPRKKDMRNNDPFHDVITRHTSFGFAVLRVWQSVFDDLEQLTELTREFVHEAADSLKARRG